ncbi:MAG: hypothetical protein HY854_23745 [Burkholderiales bacterium]|nr:hypothetical protein [Burkholderiales bacterium]
MLKKKLLLSLVGGLLAFGSLAQTPPPAAAPARPQIATTKVPGTDNVYVFRNGGHQAMFIVTSAGVIATVPVAYGRPSGGQTIPVGSFPGRGMIDFHPLEAEGFLQKMLEQEWDTLIPGHAGPGDRLGTKQDVRDQLKLLRDASAERKGGRGT